MAVLAYVPPLARPATILRAATASHVGFFTAGVLFTGLLVSILTTPDPLWWQLHFSQLGTFSVFSGFAFNATIICTSIGVVAFALRLRVELSRHAGTAVLTDRRSAKVVPTFVALLGINLSVVGFVPVNANEFLHDRGSTGAVFSFIAILASSRWMLRGMHRAVARATRIVTVGLIATTAPYIAGYINMAAFELIVFGLVFWWLLLFARTIGRPSPVPVREASTSSRIGSLSRTVVVGSRPRGAHVSMGSRGALSSWSHLRAAAGPSRGLRAGRRPHRYQGAGRPEPGRSRSRFGRPHVVTRV